MNEPTPPYPERPHLIDPKNGLDACLDLFIADGQDCCDRPAASRFLCRTPDRCPSGLIACPGLVDLSARLGSIESELKPPRSPVV
jgi:hypothetical protein